MPRGGPRSASRRSDTSEADADQQLAETELAKLQRQYRIMEGDRNAYNIESQDMIRRQLAEIKKLEGEKKELNKDLTLSESNSNTSKDENNIMKLQALCEERDDYERLINEEKEKQREIDTKTREGERELKSQHKNMGGVHASAAHTKQTMKNIQVLENRLDKANRKFNQMLTRNAELREEIDSLRVERARFEGIRKKLEKERQDLRNDIGKVIDESTTAYDQRDEAQAKMILLKEKADKDMSQHNAEMKELQRIIDHDRKLREFMMIKSKEREEDEYLRAIRQKKESEEAERKRKQRQEDSIEAYEEAFERIKEITDEEDLDKLVNKFIEGIDSLFTKINCDRSTINDMLGSAAGVQDENMMMYLGIIEQKTNELLSVQAYIQAKDIDRSYDVKTTGLLGEGPAPPVQTLAIMPPSTGDEYDSDADSQLSDEDNRPLTEQEIKQKIMKHVYKKEAAQAKRGFQYDLSGAKDLKAKPKVSDSKKRGAKH
ncbi:coiled-coil domain-containing protein 63-like [Saccoglossus kowalevskii]|uniref:Coiled-coil domain-containing protein 63-like n=1 Tax=Saccoglossus kowalevskii TaxID=10224 RepID=A0ABM0GNC3_SACKO|nr:PREDICTED: coiled-coil domain-containing protein 63-like [Saccoglossus kowalevskii]